MSIDVVGAIDDSRRVIGRISRLLLCAMLWCVAVDIGGQASYSGYTPYWETSTGEREMGALMRAYPHRVRDARKIDGEWGITINGMRLWWAYGRMLPHEERHNHERYQSIRFYRYYTGPVRARIFTPQQEAFLRTVFTERQPASIRRHNAFLDNLYGIYSREDAEAVMVRVDFFNHAVRVHPLLRHPLTRVERRIRRLAARDAEIRMYLDGIEALSGYFWRTIRGTDARSYHAYGVAVDLLSHDYRRLHVYWRWSAEGGETEWWKIPYSRRWSPPQQIIDAFEAEGFVWGGKWLFFDTVHFEYRPELMGL